MVQASLDDEDVFALVGEGKFSAIGDGALRRSFELRDEAGRKVYTFDARETKPLESDQTVSAAAKEFDDFRVPRPLRSAQPVQAPHKFLNFFFRCFKAQIGGFPWIRSQRVLRWEILLIFGCFCLRCRHVRWRDECHRRFP